MVKLALVIHNHQPVGNFDFVIEDSFQKSYKPFLETLKRFPSVKITIHFTGILYEWFKKHHPEYFDLLKEMQSSGQIEIMGGGFFEPILPILPASDSLGQLNYMADFTKENFGTSPRGVWLAERVWEPHLAKAIADSGAEYVLLDDSHFKDVGLLDDELQGYYITEDQGVPLKILPGSKKLRYLMPFEKPQDTIDFLGTMNTGENNVVFTGDDGEKFGVWPGTYNTVYTEGWLENFFSLLEQNSEWLTSVTCSEAIDGSSSLGNLYLSTSSYAEMMEWALPVRSQKEFSRCREAAESDEIFSPFLPFMKGGFWRNFLRKYRESNNMHKKMLEVSTMCQKSRLSKKKLDEARRELYQGQCNCSYWHGVFGGLYLPHLRMAIYEHLIKAEKILSAGEKKPSFNESDFLIDGTKVLALKNEKLKMYLNLSKGGTAFELDFFPKNFNFLGILSRQREAYHDKIISMGTGSGEEETKSIHDIVVLKEEGLADAIHYDAYQRGSLVEHIFEEGQGPELFRDGKLKEAAPFLRGPSSCCSKKLGDALSSKIEMDGAVLLASGESQLAVSKEIKLEKSTSGYSVVYTLKNKGQTGNIKCNFGVEFCANPLYQDPGSTFVSVNGRKYGIKETQADTAVLGAALHIHDIGVIINILSDREGTLWHVPIDTVSQAESGIEKNYQGSSFLLFWSIDIRPGADWTVTVENMIKEI